MSAKDRETYKRLNPVISGWGDNGEAVYLQSKAEEKEAEKQFKAGAFNVYISDRISPNRSLPDPRPFECSKVDYSHKLDKLGTASVVIIFTDEIWSALIRTVSGTCVLFDDNHCSRTCLLLDVVCLDANAGSHFERNHLSR